MEKQESENVSPDGSNSFLGDKDGPISQVKEVVPDAYIPDFRIKSHIKTSDPVILQQTKAQHGMPFSANGAIDRTSMTKWVDEAISKRVGPALPDDKTLAEVRAGIVQLLPEEHQDPNQVLESLLSIPGAVSSAKLSNHYYGFVSGGTLPIAEAANALVAGMDLNVMVHDANTSVAVDIEAATLKMLLQVLNLSEDQWLGRTLTTGATGSNILALAAARDTLISRLLVNEFPNDGFAAATQGLLSACAMVGIKNIKILSQKAHSSIYKAAGILGLGRGSVIECGRQDESWRWDWDKVQAELADDSAICIAVVSCGEVDTGCYGSFGEGHLGDMSRLRSLMHATRCGGWIHVDGAFGIFGRALPDSPEFSVQKFGCEGLEYADSIGADAHKCLNVPYETAFLFTRKAESLVDICSNGQAAYLATAPTTGIISPLNTSLENSRRFRALPIYAVLLNLGRSGLAELFASQILLARAIAERIHNDHSEHLELLPLPKADETWEEQKRQIGIIVLFRARDEELNKVLTDRINAHKEIFVSGTSYEGRKAVRIAVAGWDIDHSDSDNSDAKVVCGVMDDVLADWKVELAESEKAWDAELERMRKERDEEQKMAASRFDTISSDSESAEKQDPERQTTPLNTANLKKHTKQSKRLSIVCVPEHGMAPATRVLSDEAQLMRMAFEMKAPTFLAEDVGDSGALEPRTNVQAKTRCERERESARLKRTGSPHSALAVHALRTPVMANSLLTMLDGEEDGDQVIVDDVHAKEKKWKGKEKKVVRGEMKTALEAGIAPFMVTLENAGSTSPITRHTKDIDEDESPKGTKTPMDQHGSCPPRTPPEARPTFEALD